MVVHKDEGFEEGMEQNQLYVDEVEKRASVLFNKKIPIRLKIHLQDSG